VLVFGQVFQFMRSVFSLLRSKFIMLNMLESYKIPPTVHENTDSLYADGDMLSNSACTTNKHNV